MDCSSHICEFFSDLHIHQTPSMHDLIKIVVPKISAEWEDVAYALQFNIPTIESIVQRHNNNSKKCCKELFKIWLTTNLGVIPKIWATLLDKLKEVPELWAAVEEITRELFMQS